MSAFFAIFFYCYTRNKKESAEVPKILCHFTRFRDLPLASVIPQKLHKMRLRRLVHRKLRNESRMRVPTYVASTGSGGADHFFLFFFSKFMQAIQDF
ncbi:unnamed protein product [Coffea canephora]|uniref:Uncharacterized protein n=1 Tax=Coffea canephora TaxID=49390 RepID=A0A068UQ52_COFCA|nr:unnamed protein product [Coffea canephora]